MPFNSSLPYFGFFSIAIINILRGLIFAIWLVVGAIFWIPFLARMIAVFIVSVLSSASSGTSMKRAEHGLNTAVIFYVSGFQRINEGINNIIEGRTEIVHQPLIPQESIWTFAAQIAYTIVFWVSTLWLLGFRLPL